MWNNQDEYRSFTTRYMVFAFLRGFHFFSAVLVPIYTIWAGLNPGVVPWIQAWFMFWQFTFEVPTGTISDRWGRKASLVLGALATVLAVLVYGSYPSILIFLLGELLFALGAALVSGADEALLYDRLVELGRKDQMTHLSGKAHWAHLAGIALSAPIGSWLAGNFGLNAPMTFTAVPALLAAIIGWTMVEPRSTGYESASDRVSFIQLFKEGVFAVLQEPRVWPYILSTATFSLAGYYAIWLYQPRLEQLGIDPRWYGGFHTFFIVVEMAIAWHFAHIKRRFDLRQAIFVAALISSFGFVVASLVNHWLGVAFFIATTGAVGLSFNPFLSQEVNELLQSQTRGTSLSMVKMSSHVARLFGNIVIGFFIGGYLQGVLLGLAILPLFTLLILPKFRSR